MISIVIPLYNKAEQIARTLESVLKQTVADWELVVVDDGSLDNGPDVVAGYHDPRIRLVRQPNGGVSTARNRGVDETSSEWVAFVDADDYWAPDHLATLLLIIDKYPKAVVAATAYNIVSDSGVVRKVRLRRPDEAPYLIRDYFLDVIEVSHPVSSSSVAVNKEAFNRIGKFPLGIKSGEDIITWARLACAGDVAYSGKATAYISAPPTGDGRVPRVVRVPQQPDYVGVALRQLRNEHPSHADSLTRFEASWYRIRAMLNLELNARLKCLKELRKAVALTGITSKDMVCVGLLAVPLFVRTRLVSAIRRNRART